MASGKTKTSRLSFNLKRFAGFLKLFLRNKRAALGLAIIIGFGVIAIAAPLLTRYNALGQDPTYTGFVAGKYAAPLWLKQLPTWLGGDPALSENKDVMSNPSAPKLWPDGELNYTETNSTYTSAYFDSNVNYPYEVPGMNFQNEQGSLAATYQRSADELRAYGATMTFYRDFDYQWSGVPGITIGNIEILVNGSREIRWNPIEQWYVLRIDNNNQQKDVLNASLVLKTSSRSGLYVAASLDITKYYGTNTLASASLPNRTWHHLGYKSWQEWINGSGTNSTYHWNDMSWWVSEGSLTSMTYDQIKNSTNPSMYPDIGNVTYYSFMNDTKICDPYLNVTGSGPNIYPPLKWIKTFSPLRVDAPVGSTKVYVSSLVGFNAGDEVLIGSEGREEPNKIVNTYANDSSIEFAYRLLADHLTDEPVTLVAEKLPIFSGITIPKKGGAIWVLIKLVLTDPDAIYSIEVVTPTNTGRVLYANNPWPYPGSNDSKTYTTFKNWKVARKWEYLKVPVRIRVYFGTVDEPLENMTKLYPTFGRLSTGFNQTLTTKDVFIDRPLSGNPSNEYWIISRKSRRNFISLIQLELRTDNIAAFPKTPGRYRYMVEVSFLDKWPVAEDVSTVVHIDDFELKLLGTSFGLLGTDQYAQDLFSQLIYGTRISLYIGILVAVMSVAIGVAVGLVSGYMGGAVDQALMRFNDLLLVLPGLPLLIVLVAVLGARIENLILLLGLLGWNGFARVVRSQVLSLKERPFIEAAKAAGAGTGHIIVRHILPNVMALVYVSLATSVPGAITAEAALSWLGFYDPLRMSWGRMLHEVFVAGATRSWWWILPPGLCIALIATAFILLGYALDEVLNPKLRMRR